jgi:hypothetical protein
MATVQQRSDMREAAWRLVAFLRPAYFIDGRSAQHLIATLIVNKALGVPGHGVGARQNAWRRDRRCDQRQAPSPGGTA